MVDITEISAIVAAAGVLVGVVLTVLELRHLVKQRQTDLVMRLYSTFGTPEFQEASMKASFLELTSYDDLVKKYPKTEDRIAAMRDFQSTCTFFEGIGILLKRRLIDIDLVDDLLSSAIINYWERFEPITKFQRESFKQPQIWEWFEYLYNEMRKREQRLQQSKA